MLSLDIRGQKDIYLQDEAPQFSRRNSGGVVDDCSEPSGCLQSHACALTGSREQGHYGTSGRNRTSRKNRGCLLLVWSHVRSLGESLYQEEKDVGC